MQDTDGGPEVATHPANGPRESIPDLTLRALNKILHHTQGDTSLKQETCGDVPIQLSFSFCGVWRGFYVCGAEVY